MVKYMAITLNSEDFLPAVKTGLAKVRDAIVSIEAAQSILHLKFNGISIKYHIDIACSKGNLTAASFDAALLVKTLTAKSGELSISQDGPELKFKLGRTSVKLGSNSELSGAEIEEGTTGEVPFSSDTFTGWTKKHPLYSALSLKRSLQAIKDNIAKTELVVEAEWGKDDILKVKLVDQFHGILCIVKLPSIPTRRHVYIRLPLSSFLLLMDIKGDLYIDSTKVIVKDNAQVLECAFIASNSYGTIADMMQMVGVKSQVTCDAKELIQAVKQLTSITEQDDAIQFSAKEKSLALSTQAVKGSLRTSLSVKGKLASTFSLPPKNLQDIVSCMAKTVQLTDIGPNVIFTSISDDITVHGALRKLEV